MAHVCATLSLRNFRIFIDAPFNFPTWVDNLRHQHHVSSLYRSDFSHFMLELNMFVWLHDFRIFLSAPLNSPAWADTFVASIDEALIIYLVLYMHYFVPCSLLLGCKSYRYLFNLLQSRYQSQCKDSLKFS